MSLVHWEPHGRWLPFGFPLNHGQRVASTKRSHTHTSASAQLNGGLKDPIKETWVD